MILITDKFLFKGHSIHAQVAKLNSIHLYVKGRKLMCKQGKYRNQLLLIWFWSIRIDCTLHANETCVGLSHL